MSTRSCRQRDGATANCIPLVSADDHDASLQSACPHAAKWTSTEPPAGTRSFQLTASTANTLLVASITADFHCAVRATLSGPPLVCSVSLALSSVLLPPPPLESSS